MVILKIYDFLFNFFIFIFLYKLRDNDFNYPLFYLKNKQFNFFKQQNI